MVDWDDDLNQKPIHLAAQNDHTAVVKLFLQVRPSLVTSTVKDGNTLAHLAAKKGSVEVLRTMFEVDKLLVTNAVNRFTENTPLHLATEGGHLEAVKLMLLNGVAPNDENKFGQFRSDFDSVYQHHCLSQVSLRYILQPSVVMLMSLTCLPR